MKSAMRPRGHRLRVSLFVLVFPACGSIVMPAWAKPAKSETRAMKREANADDPGAKSKKRDDATDAASGKPSPADAQARVLNRLRDRLEVSDDTEWSLITERLAKIEEIRRSLWSSSGGGRGALPGAEKAKRSSGSSANPERDALRTAVGDNLTVAEIKSRLARAHDVQAQNEARLAQAQAELRAVVSVRQEAVLVMAGLLPP
ncbi:MAG: hypothetical protein EXS32_16455 [Opitutus sp.]|nr:hypothetical protein [Opitutus sp.]